MLLPTTVNISGNEWDVKLTHKSDIDQINKILYINIASSFIEQKEQLLRFIVFITYASFSRGDISSDEIATLSLLANNVFGTIHNLGFLNPNVDFSLLSAKKLGD